MNVDKTNCTSKKAAWTGRILSTLAILFMALDGFMKLIKPIPVIEATARLGFPTSAITGIGIVLLGFATLYAIPRTAVFGAILLTGYLGGAAVTQLRAGTPIFGTLFPIIFATLVWGGLFLRDGLVRTIIPWRR